MGIPDRAEGAAAVRRDQILPTVLMVIDLAAAAVCLSGGDVRRCVYWAAAATLTASVTF